MTKTTYLFELEICNYGAAKFIFSRPNSILGGGINTRKKNARIILAQHFWTTNPTATHNKHTTKRTNEQATEYK